MRPDVFNLGEWLAANPERVVGFVVYKRLFTPYEQQEAFVDESQFEDNHLTYARIREAIDLGGGSWLLGFQLLFEDCANSPETDLEYHLLSDIQMVSYEWMQHKFDEDDEEESGV